MSPLWHHDGGFTGAAGEGEDEVDDASLDDDNDAAADAAAPGGTPRAGHLLRARAGNATRPF